MTRRARAHVGAIRGLLSFSVATVFLFVLGGESRRMVLPCGLLGLSAVSLAIGFAVPASREQASQVSPDPRGPREGCLLYANRKDPRVLIPLGPFGVGITLNFGRPESWIFLLLTTGGVFVIGRLMQ